MAIRYDEDRVKRPNSEIEYTPKQIKELIDCSKDIYKFFKHVKIVTLDHGIKTFKPYDYQKKFIELLLNNRYVVGLQARQSGKCLKNESMVVIRNKKTKEIEEISIGDFFKKIAGDINI